MRIAVTINGTVHEADVEPRTLLSDFIRHDAGLTGTRLRGPTGVVIGKDAITAAKVLTEFAKENEQKPGVKGGLLAGRPIDAAQVKRLASMPTREQMLADLGAGLQSPLAAFVGALSGLLSMFVGGLTALRADREASPKG